MRGKSGKQKRGTAALLAAALLALSAAAPAYAGWEEQEDGSWWYTKEDGTYLTDGFTSEGYYLDGTGVWHETEEILGGSFANRNFFLTPQLAGSFLVWMPQFEDMMEQIIEDIGGRRGFEIAPQKIDVYAISGNSGRELMSFYKEAGGESYVLCLKCGLSRERTVYEESTQTVLLNSAWYDYQVMTALLCSVSRTGFKLADAVCSSWEETNRYGLKAGEWVAVGDALVKYEPSDGAGLYFIRSNTELKLQ